MQNTTLDEYLLLADPLPAMPVGQYQQQEKFDGAMIMYNKARCQISIKRKEKQDELIIQPINNSYDIGNEKGNLVTIFFKK